MWATIPTLEPITVTPHALNERLWELVNKEVDGSATPGEIAELNRLCDAPEGAED
jgi:hypothetical protein